MSHDTLGLWRISNLTHNALTRASTLTEGLVRQIERDDLISIAVQIEAVQQCYVALRGCPGCTTGLCELGCRVALLRRVLRASGDQCATLAPVPAGLASRPYTRIVLAWPTRAAQPLTGAALSHWIEARLSVYWRRPVLGRHLSSLAALAVSAEGPDPRQVLANAGWRPLRCPYGRATMRPFPVAQLGSLGWHWRAPPFLLLAEAHTQVSEGQP